MNPNAVSPLKDLYHLLEVARLEAKFREQGLVVYLIDIALAEIAEKTAQEKDC